MPERIFKYHTTEDLIAGVKNLAKSLAAGSGPTLQLKNSQTGFLKVTGEVSPGALRNSYNLGRWEIWLRGQGVDGNPPDDICAQLEQTSPLLEKVMKIKTVYW